MNNLPARRAFNRAGAANLEQQINTALNQLAADHDRAQTDTRRRAEADRAREGSISRERIQTALTARADGLAAVRDATGWHTVLRLNTRSVTVPGPHGRNRTIAISRIRDVRP